MATRPDSQTRVAGARRPARFSASLSGNLVCDPLETRQSPHAVPKGWLGLQVVFTVGGRRADGAHQFAASPLERTNENVDSPLAIGRARGRRAPPVPPSKPLQHPARKPILTLGPSLPAQPLQ